MIFEYRNLRTFLIEAKRRIGVRRMCEWLGGPGLILRQDVDLDILPARRLADVEMDAGVRSTFFVLTTSDTYNVASARNRSLLQSLVADGFEIGLHFDPTLYDMSSHEALAHAVATEAAILCEATGMPVQSVSLHNPSEYGVYPQFEGFINAYDPRIFAPDRYLSDSRLHFRQNPWDFLDRGVHAVIQLLLHPLHYGETGGHYPAPMLEYIDRVVDTVDAAFAPNSEYRRRCAGGLRAAWEHSRDGRGLHTGNRAASPDGGQS